MDIRVGNRLSRGMGRLRDRQRRRSEDRFAERFAHQWGQIRADRRHEPEALTIQAGPSNFSRAQVPWAVDLAAAWTWRLLVIAAGAFAVGWLLARFSVVAIPLALALLVTALAVPLVDVAQRVGINRKVASAVVVLGGLGFVALLLTFVGQQVSQGFNDLAEQVVDGLEEILEWVRTGPLNASDSQINDYIKAAQDLVLSGNEQIVSRLTDVGTAIGHIIAGIFIMLFAAYFFLADGPRIWAWAVRIFPRAARTRTDSSGRVAWRSLTQFVRATVLVAVADSVGIMFVAFILDVPFVPAIGVLVFLGAFIPMIGATLSGSVAVLVALVSQGWLVALLMFAGVIVVQEIEAHVLQPFVMGRFVSVHPLGVIVAIACGVLVAGIIGALIAVPLVAALNAVVQHLSNQTVVEDPALPAREGAGDE